MEEFGAWAVDVFFDWAATVLGSMAGSF